jgi:NADH:ubiquinone reductase (H+-translocating)
LYEAFGPHLRVPLGSLLQPLGIDLLVSSVIAVDMNRQSVLTSTGEEVSWDRLVVATGSVQQTLPVAGVAQHAFDIDTFASAERFDRHLQQLFARDEHPGQMTFVVVGAGFTGIELACEMRRRVRLHAPDSVSAQARVVLIERASVVGPQLGANARPAIMEALQYAGVEVLVNTRITRVDDESLSLADGSVIPTRTVIIATGLEAHPLVSTFGAALDASGRVIVDEFLRIPNRLGVFATGDTAHARVDAEHTALMSCQHAMTMGKYAGANVARDLLGLALKPYTQPNYQTCLDLGDHGALLTRGWDRTVVQAGTRAKAIKEMINRQIIYPPLDDPDALLVASDVL